VSENAVLDEATEELRMKIKHTIVPVKLDDINDNLEALGRGDIVGRLVIVFE
jgi:D-arabinose 1-dehydrogenase-like Zn-dependent alcohol dehydrogenase